MTYKNNFSACIRVNGKVLRENGSTVALPFGSEYEIRLKNLNSVRAQVKVSVDGKDATEGTWLVLQPNSSLDLERFIRNGNWNRGNRFKFIERTDAVEQHRGIGAEDGLIRIEYKFEKKYQPVNDYWTWPNTVIGQPDNRWTLGTLYTTTTGGQYASGTLTKSTCTSGISSQSRGEVQAMNMSCSTANQPTASVSSKSIHSTHSILRSFDSNSSFQETAARNDAGITVPGSESRQSFVSTYDFACEQSDVIVLKLVGQVGEQVVHRPITVAVKPICTSCGKTNRAIAKFCEQCGTALVLI